MKIDDLRNLVKEMGIDPTDKTKQELLDIVDSQPEDPVIPEYGEEGWEEYVMSLFKEDKLSEGKYPTLNGLRRVSIKVLGPIYGSKITRLERNFDGKGSAFCSYELIFANNVTYHGAGESTPYNTTDVFAAYPVAMAENRAEARTYRKALMLKSIAAEEKDGVNFESVLETEDMMSVQQETIMKTKCKQMNLDYDKFMLENASDKPTRKDAVALINKLNDIQNGR